MKHKRILVIGVGRLGASLVEELWDTHVEVIVVDKRPEAIDAVKNHASAAFVADGSDPRFLEGIGSDIDVAVVTHGEDFEANVLTVSSLAQMKIPMIFSRAANERQAAALRAVGATRVLLVENEMGRRLAPEVLSPVASNLLEYASSFRVVPWEARGPLVGKLLTETILHRSYEVNVLGYWRGAQSSTSRKVRPLVPEPDYRIQAGDTLLLIGHHDAVEKFLAEGGE